MNGQGKKRKDKGGGMQLRQNVMHFSPYPTTYTTNTNFTKMLFTSIPMYDLSTSVCVCTCVCMCVCMIACVSDCVCLCESFCVYVNVYLSMCISVGAKVSSM